jgi:hypothetical protein
MRQDLVKDLAAFFVIQLFYIEIIKITYSDYAIRFYFERMNNMATKKDKIPEELKILCPFCNTQYTANMEAELESSSEGCATCGYGKHSDINIEITCDNCNKVVYRKSGYRI